jgi:hypothetical protein
MIEIMKMLGFQERFSWTYQATSLCLTFNRIQFQMIIGWSIQSTNYKITMNPLILKLNMSFHLLLKNKYLIFKRRNLLFWKTTTILSKNYAKRRTGIRHKIWNKYKWILKTNLHLKGHLIMIYSIDGLNVKCVSMLVEIDLLRHHGRIRV